MTPDPWPILAAFLIGWVLRSLVSEREDRRFERERETWNRDRNALIERLVPGSTSLPAEVPREWVLGDDRREWLASLDPETRAQVELERVNGRVE